MEQTIIKKVSILSGERLIIEIPKAVRHNFKAGDMVEVKKVK